MIPKCQNAECEGYFDKLEQQLKETQEKLNIAVSALEFYAENSNYIVEFESSGTRLIDIDMTELGNNARQALEKINNRKPPF